MDYITLLRESGRDRSRWLILLSEIALTMAISVNAYALMSRHLERILEPCGIEADEVSVITSEPFWQDLSDTRRFSQVTIEDLDRLRALPHVRGVGSITPLPLRGGGSSSSYRREGQSDDEESIQAPRYDVSPGTIPALGLKIEAGRDFDSADLQPPQTANSPQIDSGVAIVTREFARALYGDDDPLGKVFMPGNHRIIGVVEHMKTPYGGGPREERIVFFPQVVGNSDKNHLIIRSDPEHREALLASIPALLSSAEPQRILTGALLSDIRAQGLAPQRLIVRGMGLTMGLLIVVSALAIYGVSSAQVTRRRRQIGMRRALGASRQQILAEILGEQVGITFAALGLGVPIAHGLNLALASQLEIAPLDPWWIGGAAVWFTVVGLLATLEPALRAARLSPAIASKAS